MMQLNDIPSLQNTSAFMDRLTAYSFYYQRAKTCLGIQFAITVPAAVVGAILILFYPSLKVWVVFYALSIALLDALVLEGIQSHYRKLAARIQESFDCDLLQIAWNPVRVGSRPGRDEYVSANESYRKSNPSLKGLLDWYPESVSELPLPLARLICQRANCWWDSKLRQKYANSILLFLILTIIIVLVISLAADKTMGMMILTVYAPIAPAVLWSCREVARHRQAADTLDSLKNHIEGLWSQTIKQNSAPDSTLAATSRIVQDMIYDGRSRNPLIFDWINSLVRPKQQKSMNERAREMVDQAKAAQHL